MWKRVLSTHTLTPFQPGSKYPPVSTAKDRSRYAAVFQDQYPEFLELQQEVGSAQAKLQQLEALLNSLPRPRSQVSTRWKPSSHIPCKWPKPGLWKRSGFRSLGLFLLQAGWAPHHMGQGQPLTRSPLSEPQFPHPSLGPVLPEHPLPSPLAEGGPCHCPCLEGI